MLNIPSPPIPLDEFRVSYETGFLPVHSTANNKKLPLHRLSNPYYTPWEDVMTNLPRLIQSGEIRKKILDLPVLSVNGLDANEEAEWQRAYLVLAFLTHAYIWGGKKAEDKLPPSISRPFVEISAHLELPPCATYAALNLWNFTTKPSEDNEDIDLTNPDNLYTINSFTGTDDERWFLVVSVAMEACGAKMIRLVLDSIVTINMTTNNTSEDDGNTDISSNRNVILTNLLNEMGKCIDELGHILERMYERNDPMTFYHQIRPLLAGSKNMAAAGLPNGMFYDTGDNNGRWHQYSGGSNAQSSLVQLIDIALGIQHIASGEVSDKTGKDQRTAFMKVTPLWSPFWSFEN
ncbi:indoleamine 2,3-dioxygenase, putative [Talaromyces stipitatus ATCC 10500]|uniref:Indoleamine 2,3-dioxygenase n=1 Tax=Talaromyces stipitatus (strain ATCC 10500 / CBS 375.48 / QM 6759 / NRRL 1006) TaxID=441959 RepID=B8MKS9_TALSN|nr:indoleamine 2,3-dioxygenase, putative [Talaromyces stipitatus ATCC 10500]EED14928.1 indoleamine 2,3-dioxygenase, putative [Talaromyces stipitatus ATCC 10500]